MKKRIKKKRTARRSLTAKKVEVPRTGLIYKPKFLISFLGIFYLVGLIGLSIPEYKQLFIDLSPYHLLLTFVVLYLSRKTKVDYFSLFAFLIFFLGMLIEILGTQSGLLFGSYKYGEALGLKFYGVPLIIGVNWAVLVVCCSTWMSTLKFSIWVKSILAAALMMVLDIIIEPIAVEFDYWTWEGGEIPLYNYFCWFALSLPMHYSFLKWKLVENNPVPKAIAVMLFVFFAYLNLI
jgi:putative membrane protein